MNGYSTVRLLWLVSAESRSRRGDGENHPVDVRVHRRSASDPLIQSAAADAVKRFVGDPMRTGGSADLARAVWWYRRYTVERLRHQAFKALVQAFPEKKQLIVDPLRCSR